MDAHHSNVVDLMNDVGRLTREREVLVKALKEIAGEPGSRYPSSTPISVAKNALASLKESA